MHKKSINKRELNLKENENKKDNFITLVLKRVKLSSLILLVIALVANTYAWYIYATKASTGIEVYVTSWNVTFQAGDSESTTNIEINVENICPGMEKWTREIGVTNKGETPAKLEYEINSITILDKTYTIGTDGVTKEQIAKLIKDFPFKIEILVDQGNIELVDGKGKFTVNVWWDFESGNDELDTKWGQDAYNFKQANPDKSCLHMDVLLKAIQLGE